MSDYSRPLVLGEVVYRAYSPLKLGKVVSASPPVAGRSPTDERYAQVVEVEWAKDGSRESFKGSHLDTLEVLIADHEKKLAGHKRRMAAMQAWVPGTPGPKLK